MSLYRFIKNDRFISSFIVATIGYERNLFQKVIAKMDFCN